MKNTKTITITLTGIAIILLTSIFILSYQAGYFENYGLCKPGREISRNGRGGHFCYTPSGRAGQVCNNKTDCGTGSCVLINSQTDYKGQCADGGIYDCAVTIDEVGNPSEPNCGF